MILCHGMGLRVRNQQSKLLVGGYFGLLGFYEDWYGTGLQDVASGCLLSLTLLLASSQ